MHIFLVSLTIFLFISCGYKPTANYAAQTLAGKTYVSVDIDIDNAVNTVLIKDALIELVIGKFDTRVTSNKSLASSFVSAKLKSVSQTQLQSDEQAFSKRYRESVSLEVKMFKLKEKPIKINVSNYHDFFIDANSVVTQAKKDDAIKIAIVKALSDVFSNIAVKSLKE